MTISEFIKGLETIKEVCGDLTVCIYDAQSRVEGFEIRESKYVDFKEKTTYPAHQYLILS